MTYLCLYSVGHLIPVGFDWLCCYGPRNLPPFFIPWTYFVLDFVDPPALFAFMILAIILRVRNYRGPRLVHRAGLSVVSRVVGIVQSRSGRRDL